MTVSSKQLWRFEQHTITTFRKPCKFGLWKENSGGFKLNAERTAVFYSWKFRFLFENSGGFKCHIFITKEISLYCTSVKTLRDILKGKPF